MSSSFPRAKAFLCFGLLAAAMAAVPARAQTMYRYKDANGVWVYTDRKPGGEQAFQEQQIERRFEMRFLEHAEKEPLDVRGIRVTPFEVLHPSGAPPYALRIEHGGKVLAFSGDTKWTESLFSAANGADLFITECFTFTTPSGYHTAWSDIAPNLDRLGARRVLLTHMGPDTLAHRHTLKDSRVLLAEDGMQLEI